MEKQENFFRTLNALSVDVAIGAVGCSAFLAHALHGRLTGPAAIALMLTTWGIYTVDHLKDAARTDSPSTYRHRIHRDYAKVLWIAVAAATVVNIVTLFFLERWVLIAGILVILLASTYLLFQRYLSLFKELAIAVIYTAGILVAASVHPDELSQHPAIVAMFILTAYINLTTFSWFDLNVDLKENHPSVAVTLGSRRVVWIILFCFVVVSIMAWRELSAPAADLLWLICFFHLAMILFKAYFGKHDRFRIFGDGFFLLPGIYFLIEALL